jgi:hypothetical protein
MKRMLGRIVALAVLIVATVSGGASAQHPGRAGGGERRGVDGQPAADFPSRFRERLGASTFLLNVVAHRRHLSASWRHSALLFGSRANFAVRSHSAACFKKSSGKFMGRSSSFLGASFARPLGSQLAHTIVEPN